MELVLRSFVQYNDKEQYVNVFMKELRFEKFYLYNTYIKGDMRAK